MLTRYVWTGPVLVIIGLAFGSAEATAAGIGALIVATCVEDHLNRRGFRWWYTVGWCICLAITAPAAWAWAVGYALVGGILWWDLITPPSLQA